jgi:hypothetical protein
MPGDEKSAAAQSGGAIQPPPPNPRPPVQAVNAPPSGGTAQKPQYVYTDTATGAVVEVVVNSAEDDIFNGILSALGAHVLRDGDRQPTMRLSIQGITASVYVSGDAKGCMNTQTVAMLFAYSRIGVRPPKYEAVGWGGGRSCLEQQSDRFVAKQAAIRQAVEDLRSRLDASR